MRSHETLLLFGMGAHVRPFLPGRTILRAATVREGAPLRVGIFGGVVQVAGGPLSAQCMSSGSMISSWWSTERVATFFRPIRPFMMDWSAIEIENPRSEKNQLNYSEKRWRTTRPVDHELAGVLPRGGSKAGTGTQAGPAGNRKAGGACRAPQRGRGLRASARSRHGAKGGAAGRRSWSRLQGWKNNAGAYKRSNR